MRNPIQTALNAVLLLAVAVLFYLHFSQPAADPNSAKPAVAAAPGAPADSPGPAAALPETTEPAAPETTEPATTATTTETPGAAVAPAVPAAGGERIAYVESSRLLDGYQGMKDARRAFETKAKGWERQNAVLVGAFRSAVEDYQKKASGMTPELRATAEAKLQELQQESGQKQEKIQRQAQEEEAKLTQTVLESVNKKVEAYGKANGYTLILIAAPSGTIAYGRKDLDITGPVLVYLNQNYRR